MGNPQSQNLYIYTMNNPLRYVDPSGMYSELPDPQEIYQEWSNIWIARSNNAILQERELKQILKQRLDPIVFGDKFSMFNQGITDALGPEFQEINKEKQFSGTMVGVSNDVLSWIENQMVQDLTPSITEINNQAIEIIEAKKMYKTYIAPVLYSALAWQQMWVNKYKSNHTRTNETRRVAKRRIENVENSERVGEYLAKKAPRQVKPGIRKLEGQYIDDLGRAQPWKAYYDEYGRLIGRTDYNAGNISQGIPDVHYHLYEWGPGKLPFEYKSHVEGEYKS